MLSSTDTVCPLLPSSPTWEQGARGWLVLLCCACLHQLSPLPRAAQASCKLQDAGELLEEADGSSKVGAALPSSPASPGWCHSEVTAQHSSVLGHSSCRSTGRALPLGQKLLSPMSPIRNPREPRSHSCLGLQELQCAWAEFPRGFAGVMTPRCS